MEIAREITLDAGVDDVWRLLTDPEELASWVGEEVRRADVAVGPAGVRWTWAPDGGAESTVEVTLDGDGERTTLRVVERRPGPASGARACTIGDAWDDRLLGLELRCLQRALRPIPV